MHLEEEGGKEEQMYDSSFKTLDASDYSSIATIDVKRCIYGLCCNKYDTQIAVVENSREYNTPSESIVRLYDVGRLRDDEDIGSEAEEEDDDEDQGSDNTDDDELDIMEELANVNDNDLSAMDDIQVVDSDSDSDSDSNDDGKFSSVTSCYLQTSYKFVLRNIVNVVALFLSFTPKSVFIEEVFG